MYEDDRKYRYAVNKALYRLARSYDEKKGWRSSSKQLDDVARLLRQGGWSASVKSSVLESIQRIIKTLYPHTENNSQHIAKNAIKRIEYRLRHSKPSSPRNFAYLGDFV